MVGVADFFRALYATVGLGPDEVHFSTRPDRFVGTEEQWDVAEDAIRRSLDAAGLDFRVAEGEGTFYGPKIDIHVRDAIGRLWQMCTIQVDFQEPERFKLEYIDENGQRVRPVMIHRALYGSVERFVGVLVEHFAGAFPTWLAPVQVALVPVADRHVDYARKVATRLVEQGARVEVDDSDNTMGAKIRHQQLQKVPYMLVVGDDEVSSDTVSVRRRTGEETRGVEVEDFIGKLVAEIADRRLDLSI
jgi:threonyl-tRNA synthetase